MHYLLPKSFGIYLLTALRGVTVYWKLLDIRPVLHCRPHKLIVKFHRHIGTCHLPFRHLRINKSLTVRMLDTHRKHQRTTASVLCHLACRVAVTLHKRNKTGRRQCRVVDRGTFRTYVAQVVSHTTATLHQLHLLLVYPHYGAIGIGIAVQTYHKAVAQRCDLIVIANTCHRTARRHYISEMVKQFEYIFFRHRVGIFPLNTGNLPRYTPMHILRRFLVNIAETVLHGIFVHPYTSREFITAEISQ